jgi:hypothetical protein
LALGVLLALATADPVLADYRVEKELALSPGGEFTLRTDSGRLTVRGTSRRGARVVVTSRSDDFKDRFDLTFEETRHGVTVAAERRGSWISRWFSWFRDGVHFAVEVPYETVLDLRTAGGGVDVSEIHARVDARTSGGAIEIQEVSGDARVRTSGGAIRGTDMGGDIDADTSGGSIKLNGMAGAVKASTSGGSVTVHFAPGNSQGGSLSTSGGQVTVYLDPAAALDIEASTSGGRVTVDLPVGVQGEISRSKVRGTLNGGGALLRLHTSGGKCAREKPLNSPH